MPFFVWNFAFKSKQPYDWNNQTALNKRAQTFSCNLHRWKEYAHIKHSGRCWAERWTKGGCDTPGFSIRYEPAIAREANGTFKLSLKRNSTRMVQSSIKLLRLWRANCDVQLLIYKSDPHNPDVYEVSKVTDYVVSYACKGNSTTAIEIQVMNSLVQR